MLLFNEDEETSFEIPELLRSTKYLWNTNVNHLNLLNRAKLKEKFEGRFSHDCYGANYEVVSTIIKGLIFTNRRISRGKEVS